MENKPKGKICENVCDYLESCAKSFKCNVCWVSAILFLFTIAFIVFEIVSAKMNLLSEKTNLFVAIVFGAAMLAGIILIAVCMINGHKYAFRLAKLMSLNCMYKDVLGCNTSDATEFNNSSSGSDASDSDGAGGGKVGTGKTSDETETNFIKKVEEIKTDGNKTVTTEPAVISIFKAYINALTDI